MAAIYADCLAANSSTRNSVGQPPSMDAVHLAYLGSPYSVDLVWVSSEFLTRRIVSPSSWLDAGCWITTGKNIVALG